MNLIKLTTLIGFLLYSFAILANSEISFRSDREGMSYFRSIETLKLQTKVKNDLGVERVKEIYRNSLAQISTKKICSYDLRKEILSSARSFIPDFNNFSGLVHLLRDEKEIDDVVVKILLDTEKVMQTKVQLPANTIFAFLPKDQEVVEKVFTKIESFEKNHLDRNCMDEAYQGLYSEIVKIDKGIKSSQLRSFFIHAYFKGIINDSTYFALERGRINKLNETKLTLAAYATKLKNLRLQYPLRDGTEESTFVTTQVNKEKSSRRQKLLETYTDLQIILMGNVIKKLRTRLDSPKIEILVYNREALEETIALEPMERFRFAIKVLRKEMSMLALNSYFGGRAPDYMDIITAGYEIGTIPAEELDEVAGLQDIWNPQKTFWDKYGIWVRAFTSVASIAIPPPYGFIPTLALVVIEATVFKKDLPADDVSRLF